MQAIVTSYLPATNTRGARVSAKCTRGQIVISFSFSGEEHREAATALCKKFAKEDAARYGTRFQDNPWLRPTVQGELPDGRNVFVFVS